jgi:hypothetical protein
MIPQTFYTADCPKEHEHDRLRFQLSLVDEHGSPIYVQMGIVAMEELSHLVNNYHNAHPYPKELDAICDRLLGDYRPGWGNDGG